MKFTAICISTIFDRDSFLFAHRMIEQRKAQGEHILILPLGLARRAVNATERVDFLYFLPGDIVDECILIPGGGMEPVFAAALRSRIEQCGIVCTVADESSLPPVTAEDEKIADHWQECSVASNRRYAVDVFSFTEEFLKCSKIEDVSAAISKILPDDTFLCVRDSFLQDLYLESHTQPAEDERFYILADKRGASRCWESFSLREFFPDAKKTLSKEPVTIAIPIHCSHSYFGYLVYVTDFPDRNAGGLEFCTMVLDLMIERYIAERKLLFANHELITANESVRSLRETDVMTGLRNGAGFMKDAENLLSRCIRRRKRISTVCVDLDRLGDINEMYGHVEGNIAIRMLAQIIQDSVERGMIAARLGADEFIVLSEVDDDGSKIEHFITLLRSRVQTFNRISGKEYTLEANICPLMITADEDTTVERLMDDAFSKKRSMKESRYSRRNRRAGNDDGNDKERGAVRNVMDDNAFLYAYQPIVSAKDGEIVAYEALMRSGNGMRLSPVTILKYASMDERLVDIELATFSNVLKQMRKMQKEMGDRKVFINSIPGYLLSEDLYRELREEYHDLFDSLVVEITELTDLEKESVELLRKRSVEDGFEVAVDDFGTGYSNMSNLLKYLPNYVKIDRSLIENVHEDPKKQHFVKTIIEFAHNNGFRALGEGVETYKELQAVVRMGVDLIQGYYTAKPDFELLKEIRSETRAEIRKAHMEDTRDRKKKIYLVNHEKELFLMNLAMENYTGIIISQPELVLHGNPDFTAGLSIKVKDGCNCRLRISNVRLGDIDTYPCIDIGKGASLTLVVEGNNELDGNGIHVPEDGALRLEGSGSLKITPVLSKSYCIGAACDASFGRIESAMSGMLRLDAEGNSCVGIGGGRCQSGDGIRILSGHLDLNLAGSESVGIGAFQGEVPVLISDTGVKLDARIGSGCLIGSLHGRQNVEIRHSSLNMIGSGSVLAGIGTVEDTDGSIRIDSVTLRLKLNGNRLFMIGGKKGELYISLNKTAVDLMAEGNDALGVGNSSMDAQLRMVGSRIGLEMRVGNPLALGARQEKIVKKDSKIHMLINENEEIL